MRLKDELYYCKCGTKFKVKSIMYAKMNYCYTCGIKIDKEYCRDVIEEYRRKKKRTKSDTNMIED
ncbi:MAG: hypothetical protein ACLS2V_12630 [Clostridium paraputrificum]|uniref:hypothetical protein n=1 Tax=Clostridium sp. TaxID=1506 RepID=UPI0025C3B30D|nr:hypothetical protein [Clostridium sp.]MBS5926153.1 hypothetical protein [Clostridium sp.]